MAPPLVVGEDGPAVVIPGRVARHLSPPLMAALRKARADGQLIHDEVADTIAAIERAGRAYAAVRVRAGACSDSGTSELPLTAASGMVTEMTTGAVATRLNCTPRAVVGLIARKRLQARRVGRSWLIDAVSVSEYLEGRAR